MYVDVEVNLNVEVEQALLISFSHKEHKDRLLGGIRKTSAPETGGSLAA
jgi:hypothetical protein